MSWFRDFSRYLGILLAHLLLSIALGTLLLTGLRLLPAGPVEENLAASAPVFREEGVYPSLFSWCSSQLDSTTDTLILSISACDTGENPLVQAMEGRYQSVATPDDTINPLWYHYGEGVPFDGTEPYYQYWHGYQLFIRPLLAIFDYSGIRVLNGLVQTLLTAVLLGLMYRTGLKRYILPYLAAAAMLMPPVTAMSLQYSSCFYVFTLSSLCLLWKHRSLDRLDGLLFLYTGIATAYFDFLTYPAATLGIPAVFYFCLRRNGSIRDTFCRGVKICFSWALGYGGMWSGKWLAGSLVLKQNILTLAAEKLTQRSGLQSSSLLHNIQAALSANIRCFLDTPVTIPVLAFACVLLFLAVRSLRSGNSAAPEMMQTLFPFLVIALLPAVWFAVSAQHAVIHYWFTNKALTVSVFAGLAGLAKASRPA